LNISEFVSENRYLVPEVLNNTTLLFYLSFQSFNSQRLLDKEHNLAVELSCIEVFVHQVLSILLKEANHFCLKHFVIFLYFPHFFKTYMKNFHRIVKSFFFRPRNSHLQQNVRISLWLFDFFIFLLLFFTFACILFFNRSFIFFFELLLNFLFSQKAINLHQLFFIFYICHCFNQTVIHRNLRITSLLLAIRAC
jgi:hypothetical protein